MNAQLPGTRLTPQRLLAGSALLAGIILFIRPLLTLDLEEGGTLIVWVSSLWYHARWPALILILSMMLCAMRRASTHKITCQLNCILTICSMILLTSDLLPRTITSTGILACITWTLAIGASQLLNFLNRLEPSHKHLERGILWLSWLAYMASGGWTVYNIGECYGSDEWSYQLQAVSIWEDHDLDIKDEWQTRGNVTADEAHISPNTQGDHWYSRHPWGLSLLLAPSTPLGPYGRVTFLAFIAAMTNLGIFRLSLSAGARAGPAAAAVAGLGTSLYWSYYATRLFTEMLGAGLLVWFFLFLSSTHKDRARSVILCSIIILALPLVQFRYLPLCAYLGCLLMLRCLADPDRLSIRMAHCLTGAILCAAGFVTFFMFEATLFGTGREATWWSHWGTGIIVNATIPQDSTLANDVGFLPMGLWACIANNNGLLSVLPLVIWMLPAALLATSDKLHNRPLLWAVFGAGMVSWFSTCANYFCVGPGSLPGRYCVLAVAMLIPGTACMLGKVSQASRTWFLALSAWSLALLALSLFNLPALGLDFLEPLHGLSRLSPFFSSLAHPYADFLQEHSGLARSATILFVLALVLMTLLQWHPYGARFGGRGIVLCTLLLTLAASSVQTGLPSHLDSATQLAQRFEKLNRDLCLLTHKGSTNASFSELAFYEKAPIKRLVIASSSEVPAQGANAIAQNDVPINDWAGRELGWITAVKPFKLDGGSYRFQITGLVDGTAALTMAIRQGSTTLSEETLTARADKIRHAIPLAIQPGGGDVYVLLRLHDGVGSFRLNSLRVIPWGNGPQTMQAQ